MHDMEATTEPPQQPEDEEYADAMLVKVLGEVAAIEAEIAAAEAAASGSGSVDIDEILSDELATNGSARGGVILFEDIAVLVPSSETETAVARAQENPVDPLADPFERWDPSGLRFPGDAADIAAMAMRHRSHRYGLDHASGPPLSILPAIGACVLFFVLASWSQLRRSRRRAIEHHDNWMRDMDLMESAYRDQAGPAGYLL